jgi:multidrug resistance efflux pump
MNLIKVFINTKEVLKNNIMKADSTVPEVKDSSQPLLRIRARKLLAWFFVMMLLLTILSKAADSVTVAKVSTVNPSGRTLSFEVNGMGTITAEAIKYVKLPEGLAINKVNVKPGQKVKEGDVLLTLDETEVRKALKAADNEVKKQEIAIKKEALSKSEASLPTKEQAEYDCKYAMEDLTKARGNLTEAKEIYKSAVDDYKKSKTKYNTALIKSKEEIHEDKAEEYKAAKTSYEEVSLTNVDTSRSASRKVKNAQKELDKLKNADNNIIEALNQYGNYRNTDWYKSQEALEDLYCIAYENAGQNYETHKNEIDALETKQSSANKKLREAKKAYEEALAQKKDLSEYEKAVNAAEEAAEAQYDTMVSSMVRENKIQEAADMYFTDNVSSETKKKAFINIYKYIYGVSGDKEHKDEIAKAEETLKEAEEDRDTEIKKNKLILESELDKLTKLQKELDSMEDGTYDYEKAAEEEKQTVETAKQTVKTAKLGMKSARDSVEASKRNVETAKFKQDQSIQQDTQSARTKANQDAIVSLTQSSMQLDLDQLQQTVDTLKTIADNMGKIKSSLTGTVDSVTFEAGKQSVADDSIAVNMGASGLLAIVPKEEGEYVSIGDEMQLTARGKKDKITVTVESISFTTDKDGVEQTKITAVMPEGDYIPGAELDVKITKNSDLYNRCVPIAAIRQDSTGQNYVLTTQSRNTVLGDELTAVRVPVNIIEKDAQMAAVEGTLSDEDNVIVSSNRDIGEEDRVRIK